MANNVHTDPEWLRARADYVEDQRPDEADEDAVYIRRIEAAVRLRDIERAYKAQQPKPAA